MTDQIRILVLPLPSLSAGGAAERHAAIRQAFSAESRTYLDEIAAVGRENVPLRVTISRLAALQCLVRLTTEAGMDTRELTLGRDAAGRPFVTNAEGRRPFDFNLSHSDAHVACAWCSVGRVGIDVEEPIPAARAEALSRRYATTGEQAFLAAGVADFTRIWTVREAIAKYEGHGGPAGYDASAVPDGLHVFGGILPDTGASLSVCAAADSGVPRLADGSLSVAWTE